MQFDSVIRGGSCVFPDKGVEALDIGICGGKITAFLKPGAEAETAETIDASGKYIFPGVIDPHVHYGFYNALEDDFYVQTNAAAIGGITSIVMYYRGGESYHKYAPWLIETGNKQSVIDFAFSFGLLTTQHMEELESVIEQYGVTSFKHYRNYQGKLGEMFGVSNAMSFDSANFLRIQQRLASISPKLVLCTHCENADMLRDVQERMKHDPDCNTLKFFSHTRPDYLETDSVLQAMYLNHVAGGNLYVVHLCSGSSVEMLEKTPWLCENLTVETTPHYLALNEDSPCGLLAKVMPAIHTKEDSEKLWDGLKSGVIQTVGSDTNPSSLEKKHSKGTNAWDVLPAFPNAGVILPILLSEGYHKRGLSLERIAAVSSYNVAKSLNMTTKGDIRIGADADFAVVDLELEKTVKPEIFGDSDYSVYDGMRFKGWPVMTISRGEVIVRDGISTAACGRGQYIRRTL